WPPTSPNGGRLKSLDVEAKMDHVAVLDDVVLSLDAKQPLVAQGDLGALAHPLLPGGHLGADEAPLEVRVDHAGGTRRLPALANRPSPRFLRADREVGAQAEERVPRADQPVQTGLLQAHRL